MIWFNEVRNEVRPRVGEAGRARPHREHRAQQHERIECDSGGYMERRATNVEGILGAAHLVDEGRSKRCGANSLLETLRRGRRPGAQQEKSLHFRDSA